MDDESEIAQLAAYYILNHVEKETTEAWIPRK